MRIYAAAYVCSSTGDIEKGTVRALTSTLGSYCFCRVLSSIFSSPARGAAKKEGLPVVSDRHDHELPDCLID